MRFSLFKTGDIIDSENYNACRSILRDQGIGLNEYVDVRLTMSYARGKINPNNGFVIVVEPGECVTNYVQLVNHLNKKGLLKLA